MKREFQIDLTDDLDDILEIDLLKTPTSAKKPENFPENPAKKVKKVTNVIDLDNDVEVIEVVSKNIKKEIKPKMETPVKTEVKPEFLTFPSQTPTKDEKFMTFSPHLMNFNPQTTPVPVYKTEKTKKKPPKKEITSSNEETEIIDLDGSEHIYQLNEQQSKNLVFDFEKIPEKEPPKTIKTSLKPYQKQALYWMTQQEKTHKGGILADEMGLGKSIEMLSTVMTNNQLKNLLVLPKALISNWENEIEKHITESLTTRYYGKNKEDFKSLHKYDFVITTYTTLLNEYKLHIKRMPSPLFQMKWNRVILDEAHLIKNQKSFSARACCELTSNFRWCLTGTPIHNELGDLYSLFKFLKFSPYDDQFNFRRYISDPILREPKLGFDNLVNICSKILLRRTKDMKIKGKSIVDIPDKCLLDVKVSFSKEERKLYKQIFDKAQVEFDDLLIQGEDVVLKNYMEILVNLLRLRQMCDHSVLIHEKKLKNTNIEACYACNEKIEEGVVTPCQHYFCDKCIGVLLSIKLECPECKKEIKEEDLKEYNTRPKFLQNFTHSAKSKKIMVELKKVLEKNEKVLIFSQWTSFLDLLEIAIKKENIKYVKVDGRTDQKERDHLFNKFRKNEDVNVALLSLRSCGLGLNLIEASHVFFCDLWWNPQVEAQALDRAHRIGQTKSVQVSRFIVRNTIEKKIIELQNHKKLIADGALGVDVTQKLNKLSVKDLKFLFSNQDEEEPEEPEEE